MKAREYSDRIEEISAPLTGAIAILNDVTMRIEEMSRTEGITCECEKLYSLVYLLDHVFDDLGDFAKELLIKEQETA